MKLTSELENLFELLQQERDEIMVNLNLAGMDARDEWEKLETQWEQFRNQLGEIEDESVKAADDIVNATIIVGDELREAYKRIVSRISED